ncbi:MAG: sel1 repeat family protein [Phycisphaerae bacterium]|nr:sel1 repeat family protein [Gemmatimonadaceae bacterium]
MPKNATEAWYWFPQAASQGDAPAQFKLGGMFEHGEGVVKDQHEALRWYSIAAGLGHIEAKRLVSTL